MASSEKQFTIWAFSDPHVGTDISFGRSSLSDAIDQSEGRDPQSPGFHWDMAVDLGDDSGSQVLPDDDEGRLWVEQIGALRSSKLKDIPGSVVSYEHASHLENATYETFENLAKSYLAAGKVDEAVEAMQKAIEVAPERTTVSELYFHLAQIFLEHVEHEPRAIECFNSALDAAVCFKHRSYVSQDSCSSVRATLNACILF